MLLACHVISQYHVNKTYNKTFLGRKPIRLATEADLGLLQHPKWSAL